MATDPPVFPAKDLEALWRILKFIAAFLRWILAQEERFTFQEDIATLRTAFDETVAPALERLRGQVEGATTDQTAALSERGLTGANLKMKWTLLFSDLLRGRIKRLIKRVNSILGSLSSVFPGADIVKEFKDQTEASMGDLEDEDGPESLKDLAGDF